ncbi:hypothetical protein OXYTRIMIC_446 [Oxytricha trifallax]|uniref:Ubiquitin-like protease family profile domain-containing protein n=1 Tax=Oxytricha trifallax TaxID=1172189 RepID=A0A073ICN1_9SPIT|nr:hypothetical protein OXYTRIMIC_446 [Oxytricha trifallax]
MHSDRSKDQEVLGIRENKQSEVPLNKQMGFKRRLKIGQSNPSKRLQGTQPQRTQFDVHMDGSPCIQADQMKVKLLIDLAEVTCQGFDKIILAKKGWSTMTTRMVTIVCCPSKRSLMEKALVQRFTDKENARRQGAREWELWTEKQQEHWKEANEEWQHEDILPGGHIKETTMEVCLKQIEEAQIKEEKTSHLILPPIVMDDKGILQIEKCVGTTNWKHENSRYWRDSGEVKSILIPVSCQSSIKKCRNWVILRVTENTKELEMYDSRRVVGSLAVIQKYLQQINQLIKETVGKEFTVSKITCKPEINQVADPENCGLLAILMANHLALELQGEPIFQIFSKDWLNVQRYYLAFNLEVGHMKLEIGKSGVTVNAEETELVAEKRNGDLWKLSNEEKGTKTTFMKSHVDTWDEWVLENDNKMELVDQQEHQDQYFSDAEEVLGGVESFYCSQQRKVKGGSEPRTGGQAKPNLIQSMVVARHKESLRREDDQRVGGNEDEEGTSKIYKDEQSNRLNDEEAAVDEKGNDDQAEQ